MYDRNNYIKSLRTDALMQSNSWTFGNWFVMGGITIFFTVYFLLSMVG
jgi:hypothetical protein